jgi:hypothetical protein
LVLPGRTWWHSIRISWGRSFWLMSWSLPSGCHPHDDTNMNLDKSI